jgi:phosphatidylglycerophosphate synthase
MAAFEIRDLRRIPGILSLSRIPLGVAFAAVSSKPPLAIGVLLISAITDVADGWFARRFHQETSTGRVLDPITDKVFVLVVVLSLISSRTLTVGEALLLGMRELCEAPLMLFWIRGRLSRARPVRGANLLGKVATAMQFAAVAAILLGTTHRRWWVISTAACGLVAGLGYAVREFRDRTRVAS